MKEIKHLKFLNLFLKKNKGRISFFYTTPKSFGYQQLADQVAANTARVPLIMLNNFPKQQKHKFNFDKITEESIRKFIDDFEAGKLKNHIKSQDVIDNTHE